MTIFIFLFISVFFKVNILLLLDFCFWHEQKHIHAFWDCGYFELLVLIPDELSAHVPCDYGGRGVLAIQNREMWDVPSQVRDQAAH